jgi:hypothetical protein
LAAILSEDSNRGEFRSSGTPPGTPRQLWCRNQWKRDRYAPSFHLDDENLDPKTWCRFPILSGGFGRELEELARYVERSNS